MGCISTKKKVAIKSVYNKIWDLLDTDGDFQVSSNEIQLVSSKVHQYHVNCAIENLETLKTRNPTEYVLSLLNKKENDNLKRSDFNDLASMMPYTKWHTEILPILRKEEIQRLQNENNV